LNVDDTYKAIVSIVEDVLQPTQQIDTNTLLTDQGLDSLRMIRLYFALEEELGIKLSHIDLTSTNFATVRQIVDLVQNAREQGA